MPAPDLSLLLATSTICFETDSASPLFAYGSAPGMELIPYFLALLAWIGMAFAAIFLAPFTALIRRFRKAKSSATTESKAESASSSTQESSEEGNNTPRQ